MVKVVFLRKLEFDFGKSHSVYHLRFRFVGRLLKSTNKIICVSIYLTLVWFDYLFNKRYIGK